MLGRLRDAASLAIQVTTGRKLNLDKPNTSSNIITGFGYSMLDIFENQFVDMDTIITNKESKVEEHKSPFASPKKRRLNGSITKDDLHSLPLAYPPVNLLNEYDKIVSSYNQMVFTRSLENQHLSQLRDWLLPMLMNGQVTVA